MPKQETLRYAARIFMRDFSLLDEAADAIASVFLLEEKFIVEDSELHRASEKEEWLQKSGKLS